MKKWILCGLLLAAAPVLAADSVETREDPGDVFQQANQAYEAGDWNRAENLYLDLFHQGFAGASLFYNLGNTAYRKGNRGAAILWFERAKRESPRDADVQANLTLARSHLKSAGESFLEKLVTLFTSTELGVAVTVFLWIFCLLAGALALDWVRPTALIQTFVWSAGILLILTGAYLGFHLHWVRKDWAIVLSAPGEVRNGPGRDYAVGFTIPEGTKVLVLNKRTTWIQIGAPQEGLKGWIPSGDIEEI